MNLFDIQYVRIVDIPGNGFYTDSAGHPIYDAWLTTGSGGFDLEAIGAINQAPEPGSATLIAFGLGVCLFRRQR